MSSASAQTRSNEVESLGAANRRSLARGWPGLARPPVNIYEHTGNTRIERSQRCRTRIARVYEEVFESALVYLKLRSGGEGACAIDKRASVGICGFKLWLMFALVTGNSGALLCSEDPVH